MRSTCPSCGTVELAASAVTVVLHSAGDVPAATPGRLAALALRRQASVAPSYRYVCPGCDATIVKPTSEAAMKLLVDAGSPLVVVPAEVTERQQGVGRLPLTEDDLLVFLTALAHTDDLAAAAG